MSEPHLVSLPSRLFRKARKNLSLLRDVTFVVIDQLARILDFKKSHCSSNGKTKIVFLRLDALGDFVLWSTFLPDFEQLYPRTHYYRTLVGNSLWTDLAKGFGFFDEVVSINRSRFGSIYELGYRIKMLRTLKRLDCDVLIHPTTSRDFLVAESSARAIPAREKIAPQDDLLNSFSWQRFFVRKLYTRLISNPAMNSNTPTMELLQGAHFLENLAGKSIKIKKPSLANISLPKFPTLENTSYFVVAPGAGNQYRQWELEKFLHVASVLQRERDWTCVVCGTESDKRFFSARIAQSGLRVNDLMGKTNLNELMSVLKTAQVVITNETGTAHLAAACSVPTICITGGGHFGRFVPWKTGANDECLDPSVVVEPMPCFNCNWICQYQLEQGQSFPCISKITTDQVIQTVRGRLR